MAERLATWVWVGAAALACVAGMVNVVGYLGFEHQAITHLTGTTTLLGSALARGAWNPAAQLTTMILAFVGGATLGGLLIQDSGLRLGRRYGVALAIEAVLLAAAAPLFQRGSFAGPVLAATAIGLQNAMATTYSGAVGAWLFAWIDYRALYLPAALTGATGIGYAIYRHRRIVAGRIGS